jgi:hypothetical protein
VAKLNEAPQLAKLNEAPQLVRQKLNARPCQRWTNQDTWQRPKASPWPGASTIEQESMTGNQTRFRKTNLAPGTKISAQSRTLDARTGARRRAQRENTSDRKTGRWRKPRHPARGPRNCRAWNTNQTRPNRAVPTANTKNAELTDGGNPVRVRQHAHRGTRSRNALLARTRSGERSQPDLRKSEHCGGEDGPTSKIKSGPNRIKIQTRYNFKIQLSMPSLTHLIIKNEKFRS